MSSRIWKFAGVEFNEQRRELRVDSTLTDVEVKPLDILLQLLTHAGEVVTKEEFFETVWPGTQVVDGSLATAVSKLRKALGPYQDLVINVPRTGYRLAAGAVEVTNLEPPAWPALSLRPGDLQGDGWRLERKLGASPWMEVWLALRGEERRVFKFALGAEGLQCLKREVTVARLVERAHGGPRPDFVRLLDWRLHEPAQPPYFIVSEYGGPNLLEWAAARGGLARIPLAERLAVVAQIARTVAAAHALDILHKDLKPANILMPEGGVPKVADFGNAALLAGARAGALGITILGFPSGPPPGGAGGEDEPSGGTPMYLAPEVLTGRTPTSAADVFALGVMLYQIAAGDFRKPLAPGWEQEIEPPPLRALIDATACGDPARRLASAAELARRLDAPPETAPVAPDPPVRYRWRWAAAAAALVVLVAAAAIAMTWRRDAATALKTVAVMPLENLGGDDGYGFLSVALADEVASLLCEAQGLGVRPVSTGAAGADSVVSGRFHREGDRLNVTLQAVDSASGRLLWQDTFSSPEASLVSLQVQLALRVRNTLARVLGGTMARASGPEPRSEQAYQLFLRGTAAPSDAATSRAAVENLRQSIALDPGYPPAWVALSKRYYLEAHYGTGDPSFLARSDEAAARALALDPASVAASSSLVINRVERGEIAAALRQARDSVARRPDSPEAHFSLSYSLRFAGRLDESARHCETAFLLDRRSNTANLRSCAVVFMLRDDPPRARNFLNLDQGSDFHKALSIHLLLREGKKAEALAAPAPEGAQWESYRMLRQCPASPPSHTPSADAETNYFTASHLAYCGYRTEALALLERAVTAGYCAFPAMDADPFFAAMRSDAAFLRIRGSAEACRERDLTAARYR